MTHFLYRFQLIAVLVGVLCATCTAQLTPEQWREDIDTLAENLLEKHPNFFTIHTVEEFEDAAETLDNKLDALDEQQIIMEINRLIAMGGDAHTNADFRTYAQGMHRMPIQVIVLSDGVFISAATAPYKDLIGAEILKFGQTDATQAFKKVGVLFGYENNSRLINAGGSYITLIPALAAVGIADSFDLDSFDLTLRDGDSSREVTLDCSVPKTRQSWMSFVQGFKDGMPMMYRKSKGNYQTEFLDDSKTMYLAYNKCQDAEDFPMKLLVKFIEEKSEELGADRLVIDLRFNGGGDETVLWPMMEMLENSQRFSQPGTIFALTSRYTYSSAMTNAHQLKERTGAILIGEPTGGKPNHFGQLGSFELPNSKLVISHSTKRFEKVQGDPDSVYPDVLIEMDSDDFFSGKDPVLEAALGYQPD